MDLKYQDFTIDVKKLFMSLLPHYIGSAHQMSGTKIEVKRDGTSATSLDHLAMDRLRELILRHFPETCTIGEEDKRTDEELQLLLEQCHERQWSIDGLDGTWHFIRRSNSYGAMVSERFGNVILYTSIFRPIDAYLHGNGFFFSEHDKGAWEWCEECAAYHRLRTAKPGELERRVILLEGSSKGHFTYPMRRLGENEITRPSLSSSIAATTVARGDASAVVTRNTKPWDVWPMIGLIEEAGGIVTDYKGNPYHLDNCGDIIAAANIEDHARIVQLLA